MRKEFSEGKDEFLCAESHLLAEIIWCLWRVSYLPLRRRGMPGLHMQVKKHGRRCRSFEQNRNSVFAGVRERQSLPLGEK